MWGGGQRELDAETVILSMLRIPEDALYAALSARGSRSNRLGDCLSPREVDDAIYEGAVHGSDLRVALGEAPRWDLSS